MANYDPFTIDGDPIDQAEQGTRLAANQYQDKHGEQFSELVRQFKRAICDAHMRSRRFSVTETSYVLNSTQGYPAMPVTSKPLEVSRPREDGFGGGIVLSGHAPQNPNHYASVFSERCARIDLALDGHYSLPTYADVSALRTTTIDWAKQLIADSNQNPDSLPLWIETAMNRLTGSKSQTLTKVANNMLGGLKPAIGILAEASYACVSLINLNAHAINVLRSETRSAISSAIEACNNITVQQAKCALDFAITLLKVGDKAEAIMKGDLGATADVLGQISAWLTVENVEDPLKAFVYTDEDIIAQFEKAIAKIDENFWKAEEAIQRAYIAISDTLKERYDSGDLRIDDQEENTSGYTQILSVDHGMLEQVYKGDMTEIVSRLNNIKEDTYKSNYTAAFARWHSLGVSPTGPSNSFYNVVEEIRLSLQRLSESCEGIAAGLQGFDSEMKSTEIDSADSIQKITDAMQNATKTTPDFA